MIPIIYEGTETAFISNGLGRLRDCISCVVTEERNGIYECDFEYPIDGHNFSKIQIGRIIAVTHDDTGTVQPFDIVSCSRPIDGVVEFHAQHISYRQSGLTVSGKNINSLADALTLIKGSATPTNPFTYQTDKTSTGYAAAFDGVPRTVRSLLGGVEGSILDTFGGEYEWDVWNVHLWSARGQNRPLTIRYGVNMTDYTEELDASESYSSAIPFWTGDDGTGKDIVVKGSRVYADGAVPGGYELCVPMDLTEKFEDKPTASQLTTLGNTMIKSGSPNLPTQNITVDFVRLQDTEEYQQFKNLLTCNLCDSVNVVFPTYNVSARFKIVKTEYNVLLDRYSSLELGSLSTTLSEALGISDTLEGGNSNGYGAQSANYTSSFTIGNLTILTGNVIVNVTSSNTNTNVSVSFGATFKYAPNVQLTMLNIGGSYYQKVTAAGPSTTGFTARVRAGNAPGNVNVNWVAIGELA